eukprot:scaffold10410_cov31-Tisochrysis_lutea.AAC.4
MAGGVPLTTWKTARHVAKSAMQPVIRNPLRRASGPSIQARCTSAGSTRLECVLEPRDISSSATQSSLIASSRSHVCRIARLVTLKSEDAVAVYVSINDGSERDDKGHLDGIQKTCLVGAWHDGQEDGQVEAAQREEFEREIRLQPELLPMQQATREERKAVQHGRGCDAIEEGRAASQRRHAALPLPVLHEHAPDPRRRARTVDEPDGQRGRRARQTDARDWRQRAGRAQAVKRVVATSAEGGVLSAAGVVVSPPLGWPRRRSARAVRGWFRGRSRASGCPTLS